MEEGHEEHGEKCQRCGDVGEDRRTLLMACLYAMNELNVPFEQCEIRGTHHEHIGNRPISAGHPTWLVPEFDQNHSAEGSWRFFKLRVCKDCRADWMGAIERWFREKPAMVQPGPERNIPVRIRGGIEYMTREEYDEWIKTKERKE